MALIDVSVHDCKGGQVYLLRFGYVASNVLVLAVWGFMTTALLFLVRETLRSVFLSSALQKMKGHLRLLNIACAAKAKWRQITLQKPSRDSPLFFSLLGGSDKGFGIFVETVEMGSKAAEAGLKRGDQVRKINSISKYSTSTNHSVPPKKMM